MAIPVLNDQNKVLGLLTTEMLQSFEGEKNVDHIYKINNNYS